MPLQKSLAIFVGLFFVLLSVVAVRAQITPTVCNADINDDGMVNLLDYSIFVTNFNPIGPTTSPADINQDTKVNLIDFSWLGHFFFQVCTSPTASPSASPSTSPSASPSSSPTADVTATVTTSSRQPISPYIYGVNGGSYGHSKLVRSGGNRWTAYNWENNASNAGTDWQNASDNYLCSNLSGHTCSDSNSSGQAVVGRINEARNLDAASLVTIPIVDYVAADKNGPVSSPASASNTRWALNAAQAGSEGNTPVYGDRNVYQSQFVHFIESTFPNSHTGGSEDIFYSLDNEPGLWPTTHPLVHGAKPTYAELAQRSTTFATMIKDRAPAAKIFGAVAYGYNEFQTLQDAVDRNSTTASGQVGSTYLDYFLAAMRNSSTTAGKRLLDVLDLHWYPEARDPVSGCRITDCASDTQSKIQARVQAPRSLWDNSYTENSWIANDYLNGPVNLIPDVKSRIANNYPGTQLAFTEYYFGGGNHISGAIAQADVLGIFGREQIFAANLWELHANNPFIYAGFDMFLNYDGAGSEVGNQTLAVANSDTALTSVYAMGIDNNNSVVHVVVINKHSAALNVDVVVNNPVALTTAQVFELSGSSSTVQTKPNLPVNGNRLVYSAPAYSVTTLVFRES
jgi:hypothetical protein